MEKKKFILLSTLSFFLFSSDLLLLLVYFSLLLPATITLFLTRCGKGVTDGAPPDGNFLVFSPCEILSISVKLGAVH